MCIWKRKQRNYLEKQQQNLSLLQKKTIIIENWYIQ